MDITDHFLNDNVFRVSFLLPASTEYRQDLERLNVVIRRLPRMAELVVQSKMQINPRAEMIMEFLLMISTNHQNIQVSSFCFFLTLFLPFKP